MSNGRHLRRAKVRGGCRRRPATGAGIFSENAWEALSRSLSFSGREREIVKGIFDDRTEYSIASELGISPHTVHTHVERLHHKLRVANRVQLVLRVMDEFLLLTLTPATKLPPICANREAGVCPLAPAG